MNRADARSLLFEELPPATVNAESDPTWEPLRQQMSDLLDHGLDPVCFDEAAEDARRLNQWVECHVWPFDDDYPAGSDLARTDSLESDLWGSLTALVKHLPEQWTTKAAA